MASRARREDGYSVLPRATVTVDEAAALLNISRSVAYTWLAGPSALIPHQRRGSRYVIFKADVERLAANGLSATNGHAADYSAPTNGAPAAGDLATALGELLAGQTVEFSLTTPIGLVEGRLSLSRGNGQSHRP